MACLLPALVVWLTLSTGTWWLARMMAARQVRHAQDRMQEVRRKIVARKADLMLALESPGSLDRRAYVMLVNELMSLAQLEAHWEGRGSDGGRI
jgi:hypothetical protein